MKIAVFCPNLIGDTVMATPTFRALRRGFPDATLVGVIWVSGEYFMPPGSLPTVGQSFAL